MIGDVAEVILPGTDKITQHENYYCDIRILHSIYVKNKYIQPHIKYFSIILLVFLYSQELPGAPLLHPAGA